MQLTERCSEHYQDTWLTLNEPKKRKKKMTLENENQEQNQANEEGVKLSTEQYAGLIDRLTELEAIAAAKRYGDGEQGRFEVDDLAMEGKSRRRNVPPQQEEQMQMPDFEQMSNADIVKFVFKVVDEHGTKQFREIRSEIERLKVENEISKVEKKFDDFWLYDRDVQEKATRNPRLSIEEAYKLAKSEDPDRATRQKTDSGARQPTTTEKLLKLPPISFGEKPGQSAGRTNSLRRDSTLQDAARKAWEEVVGKDKLTIE